MSDIKSSHEFWFVKARDYKGLRETFDALDGEIDKLEAEVAALKEAQRWIPVSERLPENSDGILIWAGYYHGIGCYSTIYSSPKFFDGLVLMKEHRGVTHWMPLPEPPDVTK